MAVGDVKLTTSFDVSVPSAAENAAAVWDALVAGHGVGTFGAAVAALQGTQDPLTTPLPAGYAPGTAGAALGRLLGGPLGVVSPLSRAAELSIVAGDDYLFVDGRQVDVPRVGGDVWPSDLTGWALEWVARELSSGHEVTADSVTSPTPSGAGQFVRIELAAAITAQLGLQGTWRWAVEATSTGRRVTLRHGALLVQAV